jgi:glutaredoxin
MKKLVILIIALVALHHFKPELFPGFSKNGAYDKQGNPEVIVFTQRECQGYCEKGLDEIRGHQVPLTELLLDDNEENIKRYREMGGGGLPVIVVGDQVVRGYSKGDIVSVLAQAYGEKYLNGFERSYFANHFYDDGSPRVYMYGASWCGYCKRMREEFASRGIDYIEMDVETAADRTLLVHTMQIEGFPVIYVGYRRVPGGANINGVLDSIKQAGKRVL